MILLNKLEPIRTANYYYMVLHLTVAPPKFSTLGTHLFLMLRELLKQLGWALAEES